LQEQPDSTEEPVELPEHLKVNSRGLPGKVFQFRQTLYLKAKREPGFRFYTLYDRICRSDVLRAAWEQVARKDGAPGVDFGHGYPRKAFRQINRFVQERLERHLKRRSQRSYRKSDGSTWYAQLMKLGLRPL
jgi:hypothetical protein